MKSVLNLAAILRVPMSEFRRQGFSEVKPHLAIAVRIVFLAFSTDNEIDQNNTDLKIEKMTKIDSSLFRR